MRFALVSQTVLHSFFSQLWILPLSHGIIKWQVNLIFFDSTTLSSFYYQFVYSDISRVVSRAKEIFPGPGKLLFVLDFLFFWLIMKVFVIFQYSLDPQWCKSICVYYISLFSIQFTCASDEKLCFCEFL